jgi:hypothetical protein
LTFHKKPPFTQVYRYMHSHLDKPFLCLYIQMVWPAWKQSNGPRTSQRDNDEAADQQLASMVAVRDSLQAQTRQLTWKTDPCKSSCRISSDVNRLKGPATVSAESPGIDLPRVC